MAAARTLTSTASPHLTTLAGRTGPALSKRKYQETAVPGADVNQSYTCFCASSHPPNETARGK
ncbi:hypothetical protein D623_10021469 [Myotis brandtii]|uniref:Uncharacterized protein n=1 Tax=Myotis brandtii TaxID=109478 RepID=S7NRT9_MYOBR|nr:hypothetical protein D623_10021469 [Myotis brandtii]